MLDKFALLSDTVGTADGRFAQLEANQERLFLVCAALAELLRDKGLYTEAEILEKIQEVDLRDGLPDGRYSGIPIVSCPRCGNRTKIIHQKCMYCGTTLVSPSATPL